MTRYISDEYVETVPELANIPREDLPGVLADAERVYKYVKQNEHITETDLRAYGERNDIPPDRMNQVLPVLTQTGRLVEVADTVKQTDTEVKGEATSPIPPPEVVAPEEVEAVKPGEEEEA
jgi:hypothetical protein